MRLRTNNDHGHDDDDSSAPGPDVGSWLWGASNDAHFGLFQFDFAKGGKPGGGGPGGGGGGTLLTSYTSGDPGKYNIDIVFQGGNWTTALQHAFIVAADQLSDYIIGDIPNAIGGIDDIAIYASVVRIDGPGRILGQAGPTDLRTDGTFLPDTAIMQFDVADATTYDGKGLFDDIVFHEMLHSIGFGTIWSELNLLSGAGTLNPTFIGGDAVDAYHLLYPLAPAGYIPVEQDGGAGTRDSHWDEQTFGNEIMTGYINASNDLSFMTVASLGDLGYTLDPALSGTSFTSPNWI